MRALILLTLLFLASCGEWPQERRDREQREGGGLQQHESERSGR